MENQISISDLLVAWELSELIDVFKENHITVEILGELTIPVLSELIKPIGWRLIFQKKWEEYFKKKIPVSLQEHDAVESKHSDLSDDSSDENSSKNTTFIGNRMSKFIRSLPTLETILKDTTEGRHILKNYKTAKKLDRLGRRALVEIVTAYLLNSVEGDANCKDFHYLATEVIRVFPTENIEYYYVSPIRKRHSPSGKSVSVRGRLAIKYWYRVKKLRILQSTFEEKADISDTFDISVQESIDWLRNNRAPWDLVTEHWDITTHVRFAEMQTNCSKKISDVYEKWPILKHPKAHSLISKDFSTFDISKDAIDYKAIENWSAFFNAVQKVCPLDKRKLKDPRVTELINLLKTESEDGKIIIQLCLLSYMIAPKGRLRRGKEQDWKFSMLESELSIVQHSVTNDNIEDLRLNYKARIREKGLTVQPYIIVIGPELNQLEKLYVIIDEIKYEVTSAKEAIDICFKAFHVFNANYPAPGEHIWLLIQRSLFKFTTKLDKIIPYIIETVTDLKNLPNTENSNEFERLIT